MRPGTFAVLFLAGFGTSMMEQTHQGSPEVITLPAAVTSVALSAISNRAAVVSRDKELTLWDLSEGRLLRTIELATAEIDVTAISNNGRWVFTGDHLGNASIWDATTGQAQLRLRLQHYPGAASFSQDDKFIAIAPMGDPVEVFDVAAARMLYQTSSVTGGTVAVAFSRDGASIATADADTAVRIYDARTGKLVAVNRDFLLEPLALDFSSDSRHVIAGGGDKILLFIDAASGKVVRRLEKTEEPISPSSLKVSPDGSIIAAILMKADNMTQPAPIVMWESSSGTTKSQWMPTKLAICLDWTNDGHLISAGVDSDSLHVWRVP
jgi:WD40 repeat protein